MLYDLGDRGLDQTSHICNFRDPDAPLTVEQSDMRKRVNKTIHDERDAFDMGTWEKNLRYDRETGKPLTDCKTTRCVAGWAQFYARGKVYIDTVEQAAITALGLTREEFGGHELTSQLFYLRDDDALDRMEALADVEPGWDA